METEAWTLPSGHGGLRLKSYRFSYDPQTEVLIAPHYGCWEANMDHAVARQPIDVCRLRGEDEVVLGNGGVVEVLQAPPDSGFKAGQHCVLLSYAPVTHPLGYPRAAHAYDAPGTVGLLAQTSKAHPSQLLALPPGEQARAPQWAAWALRYVTAWGNWQMAWSCYRQLAPAEAMPQPWVLSWGGGVGLAELQLAQAAGCRTAMLASRPERLAQLTQLGIHALRRDPALNDQPRLFAQDSAAKSAYLAAEKSFAADIQALTDGQGAGVFIDLIGPPVLRATLRVLGTPGVLTTAGWKEGMVLEYQRALACMAWQIFVHTHYARPDQARDAFAYSLRTGWLPPAPARIWGWSEVDQLAAAYRSGLDDYFPVYAIHGPA
ncbi:MAG: zinc-binding dehydrogenase [Candidatus Sericytochromatia bacterium]